jgi:circadian clock protein KaiC
MSHSKQIREYELNDDGIHLTEPYVGPDGVLTGTARMAQEARERKADAERTEVAEQRKRQLARKRTTLERQIAEMRAALEAEEDEIAKLADHQNALAASATRERAAMAKKRGASR